MGYEVCGCAPGKGRAQVALVGPWAAGGLLGNADHIHDRGQGTGAEGNQKSSETRC